ncbi:thiamine pyrophosphate-dependent enzyme [Aliifodinibius sp. S!AR15-10]|uniref:alpha-ketoacid dehydrogenase subunit alpha/beta n=1 Tax=Aliifodinibius sp. S!AR15-10 TaxID=2950437 RepID=UPI0028636801|nr:thiamine pyrophosphate-dependent enzyme [Aliifodinibius sp. S!AR15-10]MDR8393198.1 thiamine pyrophosphate-dependent enzyme [Aliifodinibius sp. S!AR15-10]
MSDTHTTKGISQNGTNSRSGVKTSEKSSKVKEVLEDYRLAVISREVSYLGRKETLTGKAKFGIFGDGKELPQIAMAKQFKEGDFRSGYYRDQTFMLAIGELTVRQFFAQLYAHPDTKADPNSGGRQMNAHFSTHSLNRDGSWKDLTSQKNSSPDISPTAGQMSRLLGLAEASKVYRNEEVLNEDRFKKFSNNGNEIAWGTIGDASTSEGVFWETVNAAGVLQVPMVLSVWDDGYGISVPRKLQTTKASISEALSGMQRTSKKEGIEILTVKGWDYSGLLDTYEKAEEIARNEHIPVLIHVQEVTQPQGHSTSGSHERYKSDERLEWEDKYCCVSQMRKWILKEGYVDARELDDIEEEAKQHVKSEQKAAWKAFTGEIKAEQNQVVEILDKMISASANAKALKAIKREMNVPTVTLRRHVMTGVRKALRVTRNENLKSRQELLNWLDDSKKENYNRYHSHLYSESDDSPLNVPVVEPIYSDNAEEVDGRILLRDNFDKLFEKYPEVLVFGEDSGKLGDVNKGLEGLQDKFGDIRVADTGIREATILGQGIGLALRGLRPITEIQYLDYLLYCFQGLSDDLATLHYRSAGYQKAPVIVRTRGHRLEGIWHTGSPMGMIINGIRGVHVCVPRNLTEAAGMYNTLLRGDDPALVIEPLNAYRLKEKIPDNLGEFTVPLGIPNIIREGTDITIVSYGSTLNICKFVLSELEQVDISAELIDVRTLLPFDRNQLIVDSLKKTNRILFVDEDVPGGASAYMMQKVLQEQDGYFYLDSEPTCLTAKAHRGAYGSDGDYFSKPNAEDIFEAVYEIMNEANPAKYPAIY